MLVRVYNAQMKTLAKRNQEGRNLLKINLLFFLLWKFILIKIIVPKGGSYLKYGPTRDHFQTNVWEKLACLLWHPNSPIQTAQYPELLNCLHMLWMQRESYYTLLKYIASVKTISLLDHIKSQGLAALENRQSKLITAQFRKSPFYISLWTCAFIPSIAPFKNLSLLRNWTLSHNYLYFLKKILWVWLMFRFIIFFTFPCCLPLWLEVCNHNSVVQLLTSTK